MTNERAHERCVSWADKNLTLSAQRRHPQPAPGAALERRITSDLEVSGAVRAVHHLHPCGLEQFWIQRITVQYGAESGGCSSLQWASHGLPCVGTSYGCVAPQPGVGGGIAASSMEHWQIGRPKVRNSGS